MVHSLYKSSFNRSSRCELMQAEHTDHWSKLRFKVWPAVAII